MPNARYHILSPFRWRGRRRIWQPRRRSGPGFFLRSVGPSGGGGVGGGVVPLDVSAPGMGGGGLGSRGRTWRRCSWGRRGPRQHRHRQGPPAAPRIYGQGNWIPPSPPRGKGSQRWSGGTQKRSRFRPDPLGSGAAPPSLEGTPGHYWVVAIADFF